MSNTVSAFYLPHLVGSLHLKSTHQGTGGAFILEQSSSDKLSLMVSAVYLPELVDLPHFKSTHQDAVKAFALKKTS